MVTLEVINKTVFNVANGITVWSDSADISYTTVEKDCPPGYDCNTAIEVGLGSYITETNDYWYVFIFPSSCWSFTLYGCC